MPAKNLKKKMRSFIKSRGEKMMKKFHLLAIIIFDRQHGCRLRRRPLPIRCRRAGSN